MRPLHPLRRLLVGLALVVAVALGAGAPAGALSGAPAAVEPWRPAPAGGVTTSARVAPADAPLRDVADDNDDHDDPGFGWGPSRIVWAGFGWLGLILLAALLFRRRVSRRR